MSNGLKYKDIRIGGGAPVQKGFLTVLHFRRVHPFRPLICSNLSPSSQNNSQVDCKTCLAFRKLSGVCSGSANGQVFEDTKQRGKPIVYFYGSRPFTGGLCEGVELGLQGMRAGDDETVHRSLPQSKGVHDQVFCFAGGIRKVTIPPELGFGQKGISLRGTEHVPDKEQQGDVPPNAVLEYTLELVRVSIPPS